MISIRPQGQPSQASVLAHEIHDDHSVGYRYIKRLLKSILRDLQCEIRIGNQRIINTGYFIAQNKRERKIIQREGINIRRFVGDFEYSHVYASGP